MAAGNVSKNARRGKVEAKLMSRWGGEIKMHTLFENGKIKHYAKCEATGNTARRPKDLMDK